MAKRKAKKRASRKPAKASGLNHFYVGSQKVSWTKIGATLLLGIIFGLYFTNSTITLETVMLFIAIVLIVLSLALLLDIRRAVLTK